MYKCIKRFISKVRTCLQDYFDEKKVNLDRIDCLFGN